MKVDAMRALVCVFFLVLAVPAALAQPQAGPLKVGDPVEVLFGTWRNGIVTAAEGLTYFVSWSDGVHDRFNHLYDLRLPGRSKSLAVEYSGSFPDAEGGPLRIGEVVEAQSRIEGWVRARVARRLGPLYVVYAEDANARTRGAEEWLGLDRLRREGASEALAAEAPQQPQPQTLAEAAPGGAVEFYTRSFGWWPGTVMAEREGRYYMQAQADGSPRAWVQPFHLRPLGGGDRFADEPIDGLVGVWMLSHDTLYSERMNQEAGQPAGTLVIAKNGSYEFGDTMIFSDGKPGSWVKNVNQDEGGILLKGGDPNGDALVTALPGGIYVQGFRRGPGKVGTRAEGIAADPSPPAQEAPPGGAAAKPDCPAGSFCN